MTVGQKAANTSKANAKAARLTAIARKAWRTRRANGN